MMRATCLNRRRSALYVVFWAAVFSCLTAGQAYPQSSSTILGVVKDTSGAVVPGASVTIQNEDTSQMRTTTTDTDGSYRVPALQAGHYSVRVEKGGFNAHLDRGLVLDVAQELAVNPVLQVGTSQQEVTVTGETAQVETVTSSLGSLVNDQKVSELPLNGRNYLDLTLMLPGVAKNQNLGTVAGSSGTSYSSNGAPIIANNFLLDGTSIVNPVGWNPTSIAGTTLGLDGIQEFKIITNGFSAEYGMTMGSQMVMVSKGGTNQFHGDAFEYLRNDALDARNYFDYESVTTGRRLPLYQRNNFGGALGGPIKKNKTFFFAVYEGLRQNLGFTAIDIVPPAGCHAAAGVTITPAQCSLLAAPTKVSAITAPLMALYPNPTPGLPNNEFTFPTPALTTVNYGQMRIDHVFSAADSLFGRYTTDTTDENNPNAAFAAAGVAFPYNRTIESGRDQFLTLAENHIFSSTLLNTARISFSRTGFKNYTFPAENLTGLPLLVAGSPNFGTLEITGLSNAAVATPLVVLHDLQNIYSASDDVYYTRGKHGLKFGVLGNRFDQAETTGGIGQGTILYSSYANFLQSTPRTFTYSFGDQNRDYIYYTLGFYVQDDWRATSRLTFNVGMRYEFNTTPRELNGKEWAVRDHAQDPAPTHGPILDDRSYLNFSPRLGFAWDIFGDGKTALRGSAGILYDVGNFHNLFVLNAGGSPPLVTSVSSTTSNTVIGFPYPFTSAGFGHALTEAVDYNVSQPHLLQLNLSLERQLPKHTALSLAYVHTRGAHLWNTAEANSAYPTYVSSTGVQYWSDNLVACENAVPSCRPNPSYTNIQLTSTGGESWYNALQLAVNKRLGAGLEFQAAYTYSRSVDATEGNIGFVSCSMVGMDQSSNPRHERQDTGPSCFDVPQNLRFNLLYHFPNMKSDGILSKLANGWWTGSIVSVQGGYPFTPVLGTNRSNSGVIQGSANEKANVGAATVAPGQVGPDGTVNTTKDTFVPFNKNTVITGNPAQWFNPLMFTLQPMVPCPNIPTQTCGQLGDAGRGMLRGPGLGTWDFSLVKDTAVGFLGERGSVQFRAEFFNILNRANFAAPNVSVFSGNTSDIGSYSEAPLASAGQITTTATPSRQIQFALKVIF